MLCSLAGVLAGLFGVGGKVGAGLRPSHVV